MNTHDIIHKALSEHGSKWWDDNDLGLFADDLVENGDLADARSVAHLLWAMGANKPGRARPFHAGCRYGAPDDPGGGDYENSCGPCQVWIGALSEKVVAAVSEPNSPATAWRDRHGDVWTLGDDGMLHTRETAPFSREHVVKKWGPLIPEPRGSAS